MNTRTEHRCATCLKSLDCDQCVYCSQECKRVDAAWLLRRQQANAVAK